MPGVKTTLLCGSCDEPVTKTQGSINCKICGKWLHAACAKLTEKDLTVLKSIKICAFICALCEPKLTDVRRSVSEDFSNLNSKIDMFIASHHEELKSIKSAIDSMKDEMKSCLLEMNADIIRCNERVTCVESSVSSLKEENSALRSEVNSLHRRINRTDFLISGLPDGINDLVSHVIAVGAFYNIELTRRDVNLACYINRKKHILVKLNSASLRDDIMKEYFKSRTLRVCDVLTGPGDDITRRVFLNDHHTPAASRLNFICNKLRRQNIIIKYKIFDGDTVRAKITLADGREIVRDINECGSMLNNPNAVSD